jgi:hypothetical protein
MITYDKASAEDVIHAAWHEARLRWDYECGRIFRVPVRPARWTDHLASEELSSALIECECVEFRREYGGENNIPLARVVGHFKDARVVLSTWKR